MDGTQLTVHVFGEWVITAIQGIDNDLRNKLEPLEYDTVVFDVDKLSRMDTAGAFILARVIRGRDESSLIWSLTNADPIQRNLIKEAAGAVMGMAPPESRAWYDAVHRLGKSTVTGFTEVVDTVAFFGRILVALFNMARRPHRVRWKSVVALIEQVGLDALPIVMVLKQCVYRANRLYGYAPGSRCDEGHWS